MNHFLPKEKVLIVSKENESRVTFLLNKMADQGLIEKTYDPETEEYFYQLTPDWENKIKIELDKYC